MTDQSPTPYAGPARVVSGIQASGSLHLGNYLGALKKFIPLQDQMECFIFVADLHAITAWQDPAVLTAQTREIAAAYLAAGLDPKKATIFPQSAVPGHVELAWVFNCVARIGWLDRMTQFKDKAGKHKERESVGLYTYPVQPRLRAARLLPSDRAGDRGAGRAGDEPARRGGEDVQVRSFRQRPHQPAR